ncbi:MAG: hypothetical protein H0U87_04090 [Acidobacteria bacterium]|jgi:hypothetical protein|nr:hypothetical protein [Acidobacteriota bacterium]
MKILRNVLFGVVYTVIYFFLAVMSTGGGHGNFFLFTPLATWILILVALFLLTKLNSLSMRLFFVGLMIVHYLVTLAILLDIRDLVMKDWNRIAGREGIFVTVGVYLIGQIIIWLAFYISTQNQKELG